MNKSFYQNCIIADRNTRSFLNFSNEPWFKDYINLSDKHVIESLGFEKIENLKYSNQELKNPFLEMKLKNKLPNFSNMLKHLNDVSLSKEIMDMFISIDPYVLTGFLYSFKSDKFGNNEKANQKAFIPKNLPLIRMMDYFLEKCAFRHFACAIERLEDIYVSLWFELSYEKVNKVIQEQITNPDVFYIFSQMEDKEFIRFFKKENMFIMNTISFEALYILLQHTSLPEEYFYHAFFFNAFKTFNLREQVYISDLIEEKEYSKEFILKLHKLLNKQTLCKNCDEFLYSSFQMRFERVEKILKTIENSSYFTKNNVKNSNSWKNIILGWQNVMLEYNPNIKVYDYYTEIMDLYHKCKKYATSSIVNSIYPLNTLSCKVTHLENEPFNILARVRTMWECKGLVDTFNKRSFCSFSILTEKNMSHYGDDVLYGYYSNVSDDLIAHIYPIDSLSNPSAKYECDLTSRINMLLDIEDLNEATLERKTYNQLCIRTKTKNDEILWPDCIICINKIDTKSQKIADELGFNIVVLHKQDNTIEMNEDIYEHLH